jgi:hypothetical protein
VPHSSPVFGLEWDAALNAPVSSLSLGANSGFPTTPHQSTATYAAFSQESRTRFIDATEADRKSGGSRGICGSLHEQRMQPRPPRSTKLSSSADLQPFRPLANSPWKRHYTFVIPRSRLARGKLRKKGHCEIAMDARPRGPTAKREPSPEGLGPNPEDDLSAAGAALNLQPALEPGPKRSGAPAALLILSRGLVGRSGFLRGRS